MALNIVHVRYRVIDHQPQGKNQGKERYPVDGVAEHIIHEKRQAEADRHGDSHNKRLAPAQCKGQKDDYREHGKSQRVQQVVYLLLGGVAIIPCDGHFHISRDNAAFQFFKLSHDVL